METINLVGKILATTNKSDFERDGKTAYIVLENEEEFKKANDFGLTIYTSKEDNQNFIIVPTPQKITVFNNDVRYNLKSNADSNTKNYVTNDNVDICISKGVSKEHGNQRFFRLLSIGINDMKQLEFIAPFNPFTGKETKDGGDLIV